MRPSQLTLLLLISSVLFSCGLTEEEKLKIAVEKQRLEQERIEAECLEAERVADLSRHTSIAKALYDKNHISNAIKHLDSSLTIANAQEDTSIFGLKAACYYKLKKYDEAVAIHTQLLELGVSSAKHYYERARCYDRLGKRQEAVNDLKNAVSLGNPKAEALHDQINPIKREIAYYVTRCCDGSTSSAKGRGACSHHGGVCNWNDPVYREYRKY